MSWLGIDVGGANLKIADGNTYANSRPFALWRQPEDLAQALRAMFAEAPDAQHVAATMTGELADCFATKREGVAAIVAAVEAATDGRHLRFYRHDGKWVTSTVAQRQPEFVAAANWHALATFASRYLQRLASVDISKATGLVMDIGSTTTDIIPVDARGVTTAARTDTERLATETLIYQGVKRTPVCGVLASVPFREHTMPLANEWFATTWDAYLILQDLDEEPTSAETADGRAATKRYARARLARMICADSDTFHHRDAVAMAQAIAKCQIQTMAAAARRQFPQTPPSLVVLSGSGEFLGRRIVDQLGWDCPVYSLQDEFGRGPSHCAPAHALAVMARERGKT